MLDIEDLQVVATGLDGGTVLEISDLKPSTVLSAMVAGLLKSEGDPLFRVDMGTFGEVKGEICFGCAATVTLAEIYGKGRLASELMLGYVKDPADRSEEFAANLSDVIKLDASIPQNFFPVDLVELEIAVDYARKGKVSSLIEFLTGDFDESFDGRWLLKDEDWEEQLPKIKVTITEMIAAGY